MPYTAQYILAVIFTLLGVALTLIQAADGDTLGISKQALAWIGIASGVLGVAQGFLPKVTAAPNDRRKGVD